MIVLLAAPAVDLDLESIAAANSHGLVSDFSVSLDHCPICSARTGAATDSTDDDQGAVMVKCNASNPSGSDCA